MDFFRKKRQRVIVFRGLVSRAEMMRVRKAEKKETVSISSSYANCMFARRWRTLPISWRSDPEMCPRVGPQLIRRCDTSKT